MTNEQRPAMTLWEIEKKHRAIDRIHGSEYRLLTVPLDDLIDANR
jgi:hypothetical protein